MSWAVNSREFANVVGLTPAKRYEYFVKRVADWAQVWSLRDDEGWALAGDNE
jgi:hypothetical protein